MMKKKWLAIAVTAGVLLTACGQTKGTVSEKDALGKVNGEYIAKADFEEEYNLYKEAYAKQMGLDQQIRNMLVQEKVVAADLTKNNVTITDEEVKKKLDEMKLQLGGEEGYNKMLEANGMKADQYEKLIKNSYLLEKHQSWYIENNSPTDEEIKTYFDENKDTLISVVTSHILVGSEDEAKAALERVKGGEDFATVAKELSTDPGSAANGGDLGAVTKGKMVPEFEKAAFDLGVNEISEPVQSEFGWHIIKVTEKKDTPEALKEDIVTALGKTKYQTYFQNLIETAEVEWLDQPKAETPAEATSSEGAATSGQ